MIDETPKVTTTPSSNSQKSDTEPEIFRCQKCGLVSIGKSCPTQGCSGYGHNGIKQKK